MIKWPVRIALFLIGILFLTLWLLSEPDLSRAVLWERYALPESQTIEIQGMPVHYYRVGSGPPLVLLHGTAASLHTWEGWKKELQDEFTIIALDLPAFGLTGPHPERDYSPAAYADFLYDFVETLALDSFHLAGNSLGGLIAWNFTAQYPEKVEKLVLVDPSGFPKLVEEPDALAFQLANNRLTAPLLKYITPRSLVEASLKDVYADDGKVTAALVDRYYDMMLREGNRQAFIDRSRSKVRADTALLAQIEMPVLIIWGAEDTWIPAADAERFSALLPDDQVVILDNLGHVPMEEAPDVTAPLVRHFLKEEKADEVN